MKIKVWDLPVRICHWLLVIIIAFQFISVKVLDESMLSNATQWHFYGGYTCLALVVFRVLWGILGTYYAKFSQFVKSPIKTFHYLRGRGVQNHIGHNPAGAYSVIALLLLILAQAVSGLFTTLRAAAIRVGYFAYTAFIISKSNTAIKLVFVWR